VLKIKKHVAWENQEVLRVEYQNILRWGKSKKSVKEIINQQTRWENQKVF